MLRILLCVVKDGCDIAVSELQQLVDHPRLEISDSDVPKDFKYCLSTKQLRKVTKVLPQNRNDDLSVLR